MLQTSTRDARHIGWQRWSVLCALASSTALAPTPARALDKDTVVLRGLGQISYNSNVLGIANDLSDAAEAQLLGSRHKDSWIQEYGGGVRLALPFSRQKVEVDALVTRTLYDEYPELNFTGYTAQAAWTWQAGNDWYGRVTGRADQSRQSNVSGLVINAPVLVRNYDVLADAHYRLTPRWELVGALGSSWTRYDADAFQSGNTDVALQSLAALYRTPAGNGTGLRLTLEQGEWPNDTSNNSSYTQYTLAAVVEWGLTGRSQLTGDIGYTSRRSSSNSGEHDSSGPSGRLSYRYAISGKTQAQAAVYQLFGPLDDPSASYVRTRGLDLGLTYLATTKTSLNLYGTAKTLDYLGQTIASNGGDRQDEYRVLGAFVRYAASRTLSFALGGEYQKRDSNLPLTAYDVYTLYLTATLAF
jgi:hypothetical protein